MNIPCLDEIHNIGVLMNAAVAHHNNYRVRCWKRFHLIQQSLNENEVSKALSRISTWRMPSVSESAGRTENLIDKLVF